jgi:AGCS family alanine or glycine:cation symporter
MILPEAVIRNHRGGTMEAINGFVNAANGYLFSQWVVYALLGTGILFTIWSGFGQYRALTHGVAVIRGKYDRKDDPGAINHFQALSAALSATVGLGNIGGVALAIALGGPGAVLWMWVIGVVGMALKMTEVTQSMLYRNTDDPENPHGGPMFVVRDGLRKVGLGWLGSIVGGIFVITLLISAITGGNMFQAWNVADVTERYFGIPTIATGIFLGVVVAAVIIGGIKRIGSVAGRLVPFMCIMYLVAALYVLFLNIGAVPSMLVLIVKSGLPSFMGGESASPAGAFMGGTFGYAAMWGIKRALFSSEAGQGSAPIAHSAAKTDEPVREGIVAGLEPFIDTLVVCTMTALVILSSGAYDREAEAVFPDSGAVSIVAAATSTDGAPTWVVETPDLPTKTADAKRILRVTEGRGWREGETVFMIVRAHQNEDTGHSLHRMTGTVAGSSETGWTVDWTPLAAATSPTLATGDDGTPDVGIYGDYAGASLTAHAFDRVTPGLGKWLVTLAAWLFAISTMISWSYYGEQGVVYLAGESLILPYKLVYCALIVVSTLGFIQTDAQLDMWTTLGLGVMLVANIPIMLVFGAQAMKEYHKYNRKLKAGEFKKHSAASLTDIVEGHDRD